MIAPVEKHMAGAFISWLFMMRRCVDPGDRHFPMYGGRGVLVCERWSDFREFLLDMGERPHKYTLERRDVNGNYEPSNCRWIPKGEQSRNRRNTVWIGDRCQEEVARAAGVSRATISRRLKAGLTGDALIAPVRDPKTLKKLTPESVQQIKAWPSFRGITRVLGARFNVCPEMISRLRRQ